MELALVAIAVHPTIGRPAYKDVYVNQPTAPIPSYQVDH